MTIGAKKKKTKTSEEFQQEQAATSQQFGVQTQVQTIDPTAKSGLDFLINQATGLEDAPLAPGLSPERLSAIQAVGTGGGINPEALATIKNFAAGGGFAPADRGTLERLSGTVGRRAASRVSDLFSLGGRGGSPASAEAVARGVGEAVAPLEFGFEQNELRRQDAAAVQQLGAAFGLQQVTSQEDAAQLQRQIAALEASGQIDAAERERLEEPFRRLGLIADIVTPAASLLPGTTEVTSVQTGETAGTAAGTSAGQTSGTEFGFVASPKIGLFGL